MSHRHSISGQPSTPKSEHFHIAPDWTPRKVIYPAEKTPLVAGYCSSGISVIACIQSDIWPALRLLPAEEPQWHPVCDAYPLFAVLIDCTSQRLPHLVRNMHRSLGLLARLPYVRTYEIKWRNKQYDNCVRLCVSLTSSGLHRGDDVPIRGLRSRCRLKLLASSLLHPLSELTR